MPSELMTVHGEVTGLDDYTLRSPLVRGTFTYIRIPKGVKLKIWAKRIAGPEAVVAIKYTSDVTASPPDWVDLSVESLASGAGEESVEKRRPIVVEGITGKEAIKVTRVGPSGATDTSYVDLEIELSWDSDER